MSARRLGRDLRALLHYRPSQVLHRVWNRGRRLAASSSGRLRRRIDDIAASPPPARALDCPLALREFACRADVAPPEQADDLLAGRFRFLGQVRHAGEHPHWRPVGEPAPSALWQMNLHYHRFLVDAAVGAVREPRIGDRLLERAAALLDDWQTACPVGARWTWSTAWNSYAVATRLLNAWLARLVLDNVCGTRADALRRRLDSLGAASAAFLQDWLEWDLGGNHLLRDATALHAAGQWFAGPRAERWAALGRRLLERQLKRQILDDGFHEERSPMYHALLLEDLLVGDVVALTSGPVDTPTRPWLGRMAGALTPVLHPDDRIALFNDAAFGIAADPSSLRRLAAACGITADEPADLPAAGYFSFAGEDAFLVFDAGLLGPDDLPAHAHCDALSFEYSVGGRRMVVDTGVDRYEAGPQRDFQRSVAAHSTLQVEDRDQGEPFGSFRMGRRPRVGGRRLDDDTVCGEHDGFGSYGLHRRTLRWRGSSGFEWQDIVEGSRDVLATVRVGLAPGLECRIDGAAARVGDASGPCFELRAPVDGTLDVERGLYCRRFGSAEPRPVLRWRGRAGRNRELLFSVRRLG